MRAPDWLTARPVAHRGLHDRSRGIVENMPAAFMAAINASFPIELDVQITSDGEAMVHHDEELGRLTEGSGPLAGMTAAQLKAVAFKDTSERMITLGELCTLVAGRVPLVVELKSLFDGDRKLVARVTEVLASYRGPVVVQSFDPDQLLALRETMPDLPRGALASKTYSEAEWPYTTPAQRLNMQHLLRHAIHTRPHFVAYWVQELPAIAPWIMRHLFGIPLLTWTVRSPAQRDYALRHADQIIFEGFQP